MMNFFQQWWKNHGTKIIGFGTTFIGVISALDQATIHVIQDTLGVMYAHVILVISGLSVAWRGFTNSKAQNTPPPPSPPPAQ